MSSLLHLSDREIRAPESEVLPDGRKRLTRFLTIGTKLQIPPELNFAYGTVDQFATAPAGWTGLRLIGKKLTDDLPLPGRDSRPILQLIYEQIAATGETSVGADDFNYDEDGIKTVIAQTVQFSTDTYVPGVVGTMTYAGDATCYLKDVTEDDDGAIRRIKRTYINAGTLSDEIQTKNNGALLLRTIRTVQTAPATPTGYTQIGNPTQHPNGLPVFTYVFAKGTGEIDRDTQTKQGGALQLVIIRHLTVPATGSQPTSDPLSGGTVVDEQKAQQDGYMLWTVTWAKGTGEISRGSEYRLSPDGGTTGMTVTTIKYLTAKSVGTTPITAPGGFATVLDTHEDQDGFRIWTGIFANGTGTVLTSTESRHGGNLIVTTKIALNAAPSAPGAALGGTVVQIRNEQKRDRFHEGIVVYEYAWAEGKGVIEKRLREQPGGLRLETWVSLGAAYDASFMLPAGILMAQDFDLRDGYTVWTVTCIQNAAGASPLVGTTIASLAMLSPGNYDYGSVPAVTFSGGGGSGAAATAVLSGGTTGFVTSLTLTNAGSGYTSPPVVVIGTPNSDTPQFVAVLTGVTLRRDKLFGFTYPGRALAVDLPNPTFAASHNLDVQLSPPLEQEIMGVEEISYRTSSSLSDLEYPFWSPKEWATVFAQYLTANHQAVSKIEALRGYRAVGGVSLVSNVPGNDGYSSVLGSPVGYGGSIAAYLKVSGGPDAPDNKTFTLEADCSLAFIGYDGTKYYRRTVGYASIPPQAALPPLTTVAVISATVKDTTTLKAVATVGVTVGGITNAFLYSYSIGGVLAIGMVRGTLVAGTLSADTTMAYKPNDYNASTNAKYWVLTQQ